MFDNLYVLFGEIFNKHKDSGKDGFFLIGLKVPLLTLNDMYKKLVREGMDSINNIDESLYKKYYDISAKYHNGEENIIQGVKAVYVLSLITSND